jgi:hypothetical protein
MPHREIGHRSVASIFMSRNMLGILFGTVIDKTRGSTRSSRPPCRALARVEVAASVAADQERDLEAIFDRLQTRVEITQIGLDVQNK